jgi:cytoskeletal protein RodZ
VDKFSHHQFSTHFKGDSLAPVGQPAVPALVALAENGDVSGLLEFVTSIGANTAVADKVVVPGGSVTVRLRGNVLNASLTVASMLVSTNDGFIAASSVPLFDKTGMPVSTTLELMAYDAGSEENTELASDIPGPLGLDAEADPEDSNARVPTEGGVIMPHPGIQGVGDVSEAFAWTEPTATLTITPVSDEEPIEPSSFDVALESGLNMISIPLMPAEPYTAKSLAAMLGSSIVVKLDAATQHFVGYSYAEEGDGFDIDGSSGYIVNTPAGGVFTFTGTAWENKSDDAAAAPKVSTAKNAWAFVITSALQDKENGATYTVVAKNLRTGVVATEKVANDKVSVSAVWANVNRKSVIQVGDKLEIALLDKRGTIVSGPFQRTVTTSDIHNAYLSVQMRVGDVRPKETILGQNFPNPFNPETWIPYQLSRNTNVTIQIYNVSGSSIRTLDLGHKSVGSYTTTAAAAYWDGKNNAGEHVSSGIYFYTLQTDKFSATRRMVILK